MSAIAVIGLGFGDEGKGLVTDWLSSQSPANQTLVVRFSGGQQAGHTVVLDDKRHVFSQFGSGTLRGIPSYLSSYCTMYLNTLVEERRELLKKGIPPKLYIHPFTSLTTPYDVYAGRRREAEYRHGSVGLGIAATRFRENHNLYLRAADLLHPQLFKEKLLKIEEYYKPQYIQPLIPEGEIKEFMESANEWQELFTLADYSIMGDLFRNIILEGSQGIMLDKDHGIFPHVTYANTTSKNAVLVAKEMRKELKEVFYVTRCYQTRHGNGWMSNEGPIQLVNNQQETNIENSWQRKFRVGELDYELLNYALEVDKQYRGTANTNLVVTCLDQRSDFQFIIRNLRTSFSSIHYSTGPSATDFKES